MSDRYKGKYRGQTFRLKKWDYSSSGIYFITICTKNKEHSFGEIENGRMKLSPIGLIAESIWKEISEQFPFADIDTFVVMPNHVHGLIIIDKQINTNTFISTNGINCIGGITTNKNPMLHNNLSRIIRWYKGKCTFEMRKIDPLFCWQSLFYEQIVRDENSLISIRKYIHENPSNWETDELI